MKQKNIIKAIKALACVCASNKGFLSDSLQDMANEKLKLLIPLIKIEIDKRN